jgi:hypothetical protein
MLGVKLPAEADMTKLPDVKCRKPFIRLKNKKIVKVAGFVHPITDKSVHIANYRRDVEQM